MFLAHQNKKSAKLRNIPFLTEYPARALIEIVSYFSLSYVGQLLNLAKHFSPETKDTENTHLKATLIPLILQTRQQELQALSAQAQRIFDSSKKTIEAIQSFDAFSVWAKRFIDYDKMLITHIESSEKVKNLLSVMLIANIESFIAEPSMSWLTSFSPLFLLKVGQFQFRQCLLKQLLEVDFIFPVSNPANTQLLASIAIHDDDSAQVLKHALDFYSDQTFKFDNSAKPNIMCALSCAIYFNKVTCAFYLAQTYADYSSLMQVAGQIASWSAKPYNYDMMKSLLNTQQLKEEKIAQSKLLIYQIIADLHPDKIVFPVGIRKALTEKKMVDIATFSHLKQCMEAYCQVDKPEMKASTGRFFRLGVTQRKLYVEALQMKVIEIVKSKLQESGAIPSAELIEQCRSLMKSQLFANHLLHQCWGVDPVYYADFMRIAQDLRLPQDKQGSIAVPKFIP